MASCSTSQWASTSPYVKLEVTQSSSTGDSATLSWTLSYVASYAASTNGTGRSYSVKINGSEVKSGTYNINGVSGTKTIATGSVSISKGSSAKSVSFSVSFGFNLTWSGVYGGTKTASGSISVAAKTSYTIKYNANGGSGAPSSQTKWYNTALALSSTKPTRTGYTFSKWNTAAGGSGAAYSPGASYTANSAATLYAQWTALTYKVTYNANGGSGAPSQQTKTYGVSLTLSSTIPTRSNHTFKGWGTSSSATTVSYAAGSSYTKNASITLYAIWESSYTKPKISSFSVSRCNSSGTVDEEGLYGLVKFSWSTTLTVSSVKIEWKDSSSTSWSSSTITASGTSGTVQQTIGSGVLSVEKTYSVKVTVADSSGSSFSIKTLNSLKLPIDIKSEGKGIAFNKVAELEGYMDVGYKSMFRDDAYFQNNKRIFGTKPDGTFVDSFAAQNANGNTIVGYGNYSSNSGSTNVYGQTVKMYSKSGIYADNCRIAKNTVLWSGSYYMTDTQTATLSSAISSQANGVVLVWSYYTDGAADNSSFNITFIPKYFVSAHNGKGVVSVISTATMGIVATKYVYVSDTSLTGHSNNNIEATAKSNGITTAPRNFVLRYVIGV